MKYVNPTPIRTSINYGVNSFAVADELINMGAVQYAPQTALVPTGKSNVKYSNTLGQTFNDKLKLAHCYTILDSSNKLVTFDFDNEDATYNTYITVSENVNTNILINVKNANFNFSACKIDVCKNAHVNLMFLCNFDKNSTNFMQFDVNLSDFAQVNTYFINFGSKISVANYHANLKGDNSTNNLYSIYLGKDDNKLDLNYHMDVYGKNSNAIMKVIGALQGSADKHFKGTINLHKGCTKSVGDETEECLMLSNTAHSIAMPNILCDEEDVDGKHATSVGKVDDKVLFYLMSRGLTKQEAIMLVVNAGFQNIISLIPPVFPTTEIVKQIHKELNYENW